MVISGQPQMIKVVHATAGKGVPVSMASGAVRAVLRSNVSQILARLKIQRGVNNFGRAIV